MKKLLIATNNKGKLVEFQDLLTGMDIELIIPSQIQLDLDVEEDGTTYAENATKKAIAFANASRMISLADDSGLEVDALNGEPGLYSARYGSTNGVKLSDAERRNYLVSLLQGKPQPWTARFRATIAIAIPENVTLSGSEESLLTTGLFSRNKRSLRATHVEGICEGEVIPQERGTGGFGYDPIFLLTEIGRTMAELTREEKNRLSHRARAVIKARERLEELFST